MSKNKGEIFRRGFPNARIEKQALVVEDAPGTKRIRIREQSEQAQREPDEQVTSIVVRNTRERFVGARRDFALPPAPLAARHRWLWLHRHYLKRDGSLLGGHPFS